MGATLALATIKSKRSKARDSTPVAVRLDMSGGARWDLSNAIAKGIVDSQYGTEQRDTMSARDKERVVIRRELPLKYPGDSRAMKWWMARQFGWKVARLIVYVVSAIGCGFIPYLTLGDEQAPFTIMVAETCGVAALWFLFKAFKAMQAAIDDADLLIRTCQDKCPTGLGLK